MPECIGKWLNKSFINYGKQFDCNEKIFIDRRPAFSRRQFINNREIINLLEIKALQVIKSDNYHLENKYIFLVMQNNNRRLSSICKLSIL